VAEKKVRTAGLSREELRSWIDKDGIDTSGEQRLSIVRQCELLGLSRSTWYYRPCGETSENLALMKQIDREYTRTPFYGSRKLAKVLGVNRKRVQRLMRTMGIEAIGPKRRTTRPAAGHKVYPYLLRDVEISRPDQVWSTDITYIPLRHGFLYLVAVLDWFSRYVLSWRLSNTLEGSFCVEALEEALAKGSPEIFNSDQGSQFTSPKFTGPLLARGKRQYFRLCTPRSRDTWCHGLLRTFASCEGSAHAYRGCNRVCKSLGVFSRAKGSRDSNDRYANSAIVAEIHFQSEKSQGDQAVGNRRASPARSIARSSERLDTSWCLETTIPLGGTPIRISSSEYFGILLVLVWWRVVGIEGGACREKPQSATPVGWAVVLV
jgi:putative transposase